MSTRSNDDEKAVHSLVRVSNGEARSDEGAINKDGRNLAELSFSLNVGLFTLGRELLDAAEEALNEWRARVDLEHLLLLGEVPHVLVVYLGMGGTCGESTSDEDPRIIARLRELTDKFL